MMDNEILKYSLEKLQLIVDKCQCSISQNKKYELNLDNGEISLLRTTINHSFHVTIIKDHKKGELTLNKIDKNSIDEAINTVLDICVSSEADEAFDIPPQLEKKEFSYGDKEPDLEKMFNLLAQYVLDIKKNYPTIKLMDTAVSFNLSNRYLMNSNGNEFIDIKGFYDFSSLFAAKVGSKSSSFNYSGFTLRQLENSLLSYGSLKRVLDETIGQIETHGIEGKFIGDLILTPDCMGTFISQYVETYLTDMPLISGTSPLKDKLNEQVAASKLTLHSHPKSKNIASGYHLTRDGFEAENVTIIDKGILKSNLLSLYGANKTGLERAKTSGECYIVESGEESIKEMIQSVQKGVLVNRVSGGNPNNNGDLSVVLKNSYYIENGEIKFPLNETMIVLNLKDAFYHIQEISKETVNFGSDIFPYVKIKDVLVSGK